MYKKMAVFVTVVYALFTLCGCAAVLVAGASGAGTAFWLSGKLSETLDTPFDRAIKATKAAMKSLKLEITKDTQKATVAQIIGKYTDEATIWIDIRPITKSSTRVDVRVGVRGNNAASTKILEEIKRHL